MYTNGAVYEGELRDGMRHGNGIMFYKNKSKYNGNWKFDKRHGKGEYFYSNGDYYKGYWQIDKKEGVGSFFTKSERYEGEFRNDVKHGKGTVYYSDFSEYTGYFKNGIKHGKGTFKKSNGEEFSERWNKGKVVERIPLESNNKILETSIEEEPEEEDDPEGKQPEEEEEEAFTFNKKTFRRCPTEVNTKGGDTPTFSKKKTFDDNSINYRDYARKKTGGSLPRGKSEKRRKKSYGVGVDIQNYFNSQKHGSLANDECGPSNKLESDQNLISDYKSSSLQNIDSLSVNEFTEKMGSFEEVMNNKNPKIWDSYDVRNFMEKIGLGAYKEIFFRNFVTGQDLLKMNETDIIDLGIKKRSYIIKFRDNLRKLKYLADKQIEHFMVKTQIQGQKMTGKLINNNRMDWNTIREDSQEDQGSGISSKSLIDISVQREQNQSSSNEQDNSERSKSSHSSSKSKQSKDDSIEMVIPRCPRRNSEDNILSKKVSCERQPTTRVSSDDNNSNGNNNSSSSKSRNCRRMRTSRFRQKAHSLFDLEMASQYSSLSQTSHSESNKSSNKRKKKKKCDIKGKFSTIIIDRNKLILGKRLAGGAFGEVFLGEYHEDKVAIKRLKKRKKKKKIDVKAFLQEVEMLQGLRHTNIVLYMGVCIDNSGYMMVTEYMERGSLFDLIHEDRLHEKVPQSQLLEWIKDIAKAMVFIHSRNILHCDLKSKNILVDENLNLKIADFGLSRLNIPLKTVHKRTRVGTPAWMSPEALRGEELTAASDVYSFGMVLLEMISGEIPHKHLQLPQITAIVGYDESYKVPIPDCHPKIAKIIELCLQKNPKERPNFESIFKMVEEAEREISHKCKDI